jgi:hypothetical protein
MRLEDRRLVDLGAAVGGLGQYDMLMSRVAIRWWVSDGSSAHPMWRSGMRHAHASPQLGLLTFTTHGRLMAPGFGESGQGPC